MAQTPHIDPHAEGVGHAIADKKPVVPVHQRNYAWTKDEVEQLFADLENAISTPGEEDYFLGLVVVAEKKGSRPELIDGQQRLATCIMLIAAIRDYLYEHTTDRETADSYEREYLIWFDPKEKDYVPHLRLNIDDKDFFLDYVLRKPDHPKRLAYGASKLPKLRASNSKIKAAADIARDRVKIIVKGADAEYHTERLIQWIDFLRDSTKIIWFAVPDREHAYRIFETLNDRGLELSKSDLLKNHLMESAEDQWADVHQHWSKMIGVLEAVARTEAPATYVRHLWISLYGPIREKELYKAIKKSVRGAQPAIRFARLLVEQASLYTAILNSDHEHWRPLGTSAKKDISTLILLKQERIRPLLLAVMQHFEENEVKKSLRLFVSWAVRLVIAGGVAGTIEKTFGELAHKVSKKEITTAKDLAKAIGTVIPSDPQFELAFISAKVSKGPLARYYLRVLESAKRGEYDDSALSVDEREEKANLEHIMPESPAPEWHLDNAKGKAILEEHVHRIGNLALMRRRSNELVGNEHISEKAPEYAKEQAILLTAELGDFSQWGPEEIDARQKRMAKLAVKAWPLKI